ncbi:hypothetical protein AAVH_18008 [Aphelenchoides avenae]|nr:hypothetical protein AAVH_18008 [Aphelenchus avenae]
MEYSRYSLSCCYQLKENRLTTRLIFPQSVAHSVTFLCYLAIATGVRQFVQNHDAYAYTVLVESVHSTVCVYTTITPFVLLCLRRRLGRPKSGAVENMDATRQTDMYFQQLEQEWS